MALSAVQIEAFNEYLLKQIDLLLIGQTINGQVGINSWMSQYIERAYRQALAVSDAQLSAITLPQPVGAGLLEVVSGTAIPSLVGTGTVQAMAPIHLETLGYLNNRAYDALKNIGNEEARKVRRLLVDGVENGRNPLAVARDIKDATDISENRAKLIARTETIQAYQRSVINSAKSFAETSGEEVSILWRATLDSRVREQHAKWHGTISDPSETLRKINVSPYNCRCSLSISTNANTSDEKKESMKARREAFLSTFDSVKK